MRDLNVRQQEILRHFEWVSKFDIGDPAPAEAYTVDQLKKLGYVGLYRRNYLQGAEAKKFAEHILDGYLFTEK